MTVNELIAALQALNAPNAQIGARADNNDELCETWVSPRQSVPGVVELCTGSALELDEG